MRTIAACICTALLASGSWATEVAGVSLPDSVQVAGTRLQLNGAGIRKKLIVKVYVAALYLPARATDPAAILAADEPRQLIMHFLYKEVEADKVTAAFREGFANNLASVLPALQARLNTFCSLWPAMHAGQRAILTYVPASGTTLVIDGSERGTIPGKDFADALFAVWLGAKPADLGLKHALLGTP